MDIGFDIWQLVMTEYTTPKNTPTNNIGKKASEHNAKSMNDILCGISKSKFVKVMHFELEKYIWDILQIIFEGDDMVKKEKLQMHRR
jgi:hypothetical protein